MKKRWVQYVLSFSGIFVLHYFLVSNASMTSHLLYSLFMTIFFVLIFERFVVGKKLKKKDGS